MPCLDTEAGFDPPYSFTDRSHRTMEVIATILDISITDIPSDRPVTAASYRICATSAIAIARQLCPERFHYPFR